MTKPKCSAKRSDGQPCGNYPVPGVTVCRYHGGAAPQVKAKAERERRDQQLRQAAARFGIPVDTSPQDALETEIKRSAGLVEYYKRQVEQVIESDDQRLVYGAIAITDGPHGRTAKVGQRRSEWLTLLGEERDRLARLSVEAIRAGIEETRVEAVIAWSREMGGHIRDYIATLDPQQAEHARSFFAQRLDD